MEKILTPEALRAIVSVLKDAYKDYKSGFDTEAEWNATQMAYKAICTDEEWHEIRSIIKEWKKNANL